MTERNPNADNKQANRKPTGEAVLAATHGSALQPCPFCGADAESDTQQAFRTLSGGYLSKAVAIYCTKCSAQISMCHDDHKEYSPADMLTILTESWNVRVPNIVLSDKAGQLGNANEVDKST